MYGEAVPRCSRVSSRPANRASFPAAFIVAFSLSSDWFLDAALLCRRLFSSRREISPNPCFSALRQAFWNCVITIVPTNPPAAPATNPFHALRSLWRSNRLTGLGRYSTTVDAIFSSVLSQFEKNPDDYAVSRASPWVPRLIHEAGLYPARAPSAAGAFAASWAPLGSPFFSCSCVLLLFLRSSLVPAFFSCSCVLLLFLRSPLDSWFASSKP